MKYEPKVFQNQLPIVKLFIYHLIYYRTLSKGYKEHRLQNEFWTLTIDAHLLRALNNWCMVFGSDEYEPTHWKRLSVTNSKELNKGFRDGLFVATNFNQNTWRQYWRSMLDFRNKYAVHRELEPFEKPVPDFDPALAVAYYFDKWARAVISPDTVDEPPLEQFARSLSKSVVPLVEKLLEATQELQAKPNLHA